MLLLAFVICLWTGQSVHNLFIEDKEEVCMYVCHRTMCTRAPDPNIAFVICLWTGQSVHNLFIEDKEEVCMYVCHRTMCTRAPDPNIKVVTRA